MLKSQSLSPYSYSPILRLQEGDRFEIMKDMQGVCRLTIKYCEMEDAGEYTCKIDKQDDKTVTKVVISGQLSDFDFDPSCIDTIFVLSIDVNDSRRIIH